MDELLLKCGEFAHLCATTKETLRHYRDIGLLCPVQIADNGYQYYSIMQILDFLLISALRSAGCSLQEIRSYLAMPSAEDLKVVLTETLDTLRHEKREIVRKERLLKNTIARLDLLATAPKPGTYRVKECPAEYYIQTPIAMGQMSENDVMETFREHLRYCREHSFGEEFQFSNCIEREAFLSGDYLNGFSLCSRVTARTKSPRLRVKPKGLYLTSLRQMTLPNELRNAAILESETLGTALETIGDWCANLDELKAYAADNGYRIIGDVYETDLSIYSGDFQESHSSEIAALVEKETVETVEKE